MAKLYFRYGAMNSGKSALLLQAVHNYEEQGMSVLVAKPSKDTKGDMTVVSRIGLSREIDFLIPPGMNIYEKLSKVKEEIGCLFIDEAQFLEKEQADQLLEIVVRLDIPVICYGLRTDFVTNGFPGSTRLLEISHTLEEMKTICKCGRKAMFNARKVDGKYVTSGEQVAIDGVSDVTYEPLCGHCYYKLVKDKKSAKVYTKKKNSD